MHAFVQDMNGVVDSHDVTGVLEDILNEEGGRAKDEEGGGSTGGSIRRDKQ